MLGGSTLKEICGVTLEMAKIQPQLVALMLKLPLELLHEGFDQTFSPNQKKKKVLEFTQVPAEAPLVLLSW
jgi:hypothetical protein